MEREEIDWPLAIAATLIATLVIAILCILYSLNIESENASAALIKISHDHAHMQTMTQGLQDQINSINETRAKYVPMLVDIEHHQKVNAPIIEHKLDEIIKLLKTEIKR
jgi:hypothetical protein